MYDYNFTLYIFISTVTGYWFYSPRFEFRQGQFMLYFQNLSRPWLEPTQPTVQSVRRFFPSSAATVQSTCPHTSIWLTSEAVLLVPHMSLQNGQELIYLSYMFKLDVQAQANVSYCRHCTYFVLLESTFKISSVMMMTMMSRRRWRGYLKTVTFGSVCRTPHFSL